MRNKNEKYKTLWPYMDPRLCQQYVSRTLGLLSFGNIRLLPPGVQLHGDNWLVLYMIFKVM